MSRTPFIQEKTDRICTFAVGADRHPLFAFSIVATVLLAGCTTTDPTQDPPATYTYAVLREGTPEATIKWTVHPLTTEVRNQRLSIVEAQPIEAAIFQPEGNAEIARSLILVDPTSGFDVAVVNACQMANSKPTCNSTYAGAEWGNDNSAIGIFGSLLVAGLDLDQAVLSVGPEGKARNLKATRIEPHLWRIESETPTVRSAPLCSVLDDTVIFDDRARIITRCESRQERGVVYDLIQTEGVTRLPSISSARPSETPPPFGAFGMRKGRLPPGSDVEFTPDGFSLAEAEPEAIRASSGLAAFLSKHPEAYFEEASYTGSTESTTAEKITVQTDSWRLRYLGRGGAGFETTIERTKTQLNGNLIRTHYTANDAPNWKPPKEKAVAQLEPPNVELADLHNVVAAIAALPFAGDVADVSLHNDMRIGSTKVVYRYYLSFKEECPPPGCILRSIVIDPAEGVVIAGTLPIETLFPAVTAQ